jgi:hypothetical protein
MQGVLVPGVGYYMQIWVIEKSGPVFLAMTMPITLLVTVVLPSLLGETVTGTGQVSLNSFSFLASPFLLQFPIANDEFTKP